MSTPRNGQHVVYRIYSDDQWEPLYIGVTSHYSARMRAHQKTQPWWGEVDEIEWVAFPERWQADRAEIAAINTENPKYNRLRTEPRAALQLGSRYDDLREMVV